MEGHRVCGDRWVAYFDILGFQNMLEKRKVPGHLPLFVKNYYAHVLDALKRATDYSLDDLSIAWFSDSFLLSARDDTFRSFAHIVSAAGDFFREAVGSMMPLRAAVAFGDFYTDTENSVFVGQALIDAHKCAEAQDWIGLVITPDAYKAQEKFDDSNLLRDRDYVEYDVPFKEGKFERLYAYRPDSNCDFIDDILDQLRQIQSSAKHDHPDEYEQKHRQKYERTIQFYERSPRTGVRTTWR